MKRPKNKLNNKLTEDRMLQTQLGNISLKQKEINSRLNFRKDKSCAKCKK